MTSQPPRTGSTATEPETPAAPRTEAGRAWLIDVRAAGGSEDRIEYTEARILATEAEAAALAARPAEAQAGAGIDVERLTRAFLAVFPGWIEEADGNRTEIEENAAAVAAEYASLPTEPTALTCGCRHWIRHIAADPWGETPEREVCPECHHDYHPDGPCAVASLPTEPEAGRP